jgi:hypothetical protein
MVAIALSAIGVVVMTSLRAFLLVVLVYVLIEALRPLVDPLVEGLLVSRVDPQVRATTLSAWAVFDSSGQVAGWPAFGAIGRIWSIRAARYVGAGVLVPTVALLVAASRRLKHTHNSGRHASHGPGQRPPNVFD